MATELVVNADPVGFIETDGDDTCDYRVATGDALLELNDGDAVFVRTSPNYNVVGDVITQAQVKTSFTGFLVKVY